VTKSRKIPIERVRELEAPLLVCAYDDDEKCAKLAIDGSISLSELRARIPDLPKDELIVFY
jgi:hypothetical protein